MTDKRKICVVITARPSYSRIRTALKAIQAHPDLELQLVVAASALLERYGRVVETIKKDGFKIDAQVYMVVEGENLAAAAKTTGIGLMELATVLDNLKPDIAVTIADRYETIATAIAAAYMNIPLAHIQGGEVTGSIDEKVRHAITKLADYHLVATQLAAKRVMQMGEAAQSVFVTGCPSIDIAADVLHNRLRLAAVHFSNQRLARVLDHCRDEPEFGRALAALIQGDTVLRRSICWETRIRDDNWWSGRFGLPW